MKKNLVLIGVFGLLVLAGVAAPRAGITPGGGPVSQLVEKAHRPAARRDVHRVRDGSRYRGVPPPLGQHELTPPRTSAPTSGEACARGLSLANRTVAARFSMGANTFFADDCHVNITSSGNVYAHYTAQSAKAVVVFQAVGRLPAQPQQAERAVAPRQAETPLAGRPAGMAAPPLMRQANARRDREMGEIDYAQALAGLAFIAWLAAVLALASGGKGNG